MDPSALLRVKKSHWLSQISLHIWLTHVPREQWAAASTEKMFYIILYRVGLLAWQLHISPLFSLFHDTNIWLIEFYKEFVYIFDLCWTTNVEAELSLRFIKKKQKQKGNNRGYVVKDNHYLKLSPLTIAQPHLCLCSFEYWDCCAKKGDRPCECVCACVHKRVCTCVYCSGADAASNPKSITESSHAITGCHRKRWLLLLLY